VKINAEKIGRKVNELFKEYYSLNSQNANKSLGNDKIEQTKVKILKIKQIINSDVIEIENKNNEHNNINNISKKFLFLGQKSIKQDFDINPNYIESNEKLNEEEALQTINIQLESIELPQTDVSLNDLYNCYEKFISNIGLLPAFIGNSIFRNEFKDENLKTAIKCFSDSYNLYKSIPPGNDYSILGSVTNEYKKIFEGIISKLASTGFSFGGKEIKKESQRLDYRKGFVTFPEVEKFTIKEEKWFSENEEGNNTRKSNYDKVDWSNYDGVRTEVTEVNFEEFEKKDIEEYKEMEKKIYR
jgi:hypothetical protein